ncbi:MAG TPA: phosphomannomutase/phosphoglucomutase, partial [Chloroflexota bacterium]|nr:phosphomannomutase/phosphoglucomutase [Chloroflexota bacterium]
MTTTPSQPAYPGGVDGSMFREYDIRGFVDENFTEPVLERTGKAFGTFLAAKSGGGAGKPHGGAGSEAGVRRTRDEEAPGTLAVGRDVRLSSARYAKSFIAGLRSTGADVVDVGQVPTPLVYFAVNQLNTDGGGAVTASHNPPQYNGLKLRKRESDSPNGLPLQPNEIQAVRKLAQDGGFRQAAQGSYREQGVEDEYVRYVAGRIKMARPTKVVIDAGNGVAGPVAVQTLRAIGCEVIELYCEPDGNFPNHMPDPLNPKNLQDLIKRVKETGADVGVALDGDGDRLGVVDDRGEILWADQYLILLARDALRERAGASVVFDVKCSMALIEEIERMGGKPVMSRTGYPNIMAR